MSLEKEASYLATNTYSTLNTLTEETKNIWVVFHGMGYLSKYFIKYFSELDADENYIIAPQAPSKYYQDKDFRHVGASWLTRENTVTETQNILNYVYLRKTLTRTIFPVNCLYIPICQIKDIPRRRITMRKYD